jgi:hypothetical protein
VGLLRGQEGGGCWFTGLHCWSQEVYQRCGVEGMMLQILEQGGFLLTCGKGTVMRIGARLVSCGMTFEGITVHLGV